MLETFRPWLLLIIVSLGMLVAASWSFRPRWAWTKMRPRTWERAHRLAMAVCACLGVWTFTLFGQLHDHGAFGHQNFHAHDFYHYYFGSKYLKEWSYDGMYVATVAALEEIGREEPPKSIHFDRIRDLRGSAQFLSREEFMPLAEASRARFTPERWNALKKDLSFLRDKTMNNNWWSGVMLDSGFNPPPSYAIISSAVSNRLPLNETTWTRLGALDFVLLGVGVGALCYALGPVPGLFTLVVLGNAPITTYNWTGGSFLRQVWVFFLMIGLASLARRRWFAAGAALGGCAAAVLFPATFLVGALVPLAYRSVRARSRAPFIRVALGATAVIALLVGLSLLSFGARPWAEWHQRIGAHEITFFDNHIGIKKITTFAPEVAPQAFGAGNTVFPEWNGALIARANRGRVVDLLLAGLLSMAFIAGGLRARPAEASLVIGSGLLVLWAMPASYYTIYIGVFAAFMLANRRSVWGRRRFAVVSAALLAAILLHHFEQDLIRQSVVLSGGWIACIFALSAMYWLERPAFAQTLRQRRITVEAVAAGVAVLLLGGAALRDWLYDATFLPPELVRGGRIVDVVDVGGKAQEAAHRLDIGEDMRVGRRLMDTFGYRVKDECGILRNAHVLRYDLAPAGSGGRLIVRTDSFYRGDLLTTVNGRSLMPARLEPRQTMFAYVEVALPSDLGDGPLHVEQRTTATDVGVFTVWLVTP